MSEEIIIDGLEEHAFRRSIEAMLRNGRADEAVERLKALLPEFAGEGKTLPGRLLEIGPEDIHLGGWDRIADKVQEYSRASTPITAIGIGIGDPADTGLIPDDQGNLRPPLETSYYSDATFPFSETDRADLLEGYSAFGCEWQGDHDQIDDTLSIEGIDDLYGAIARLENDVAASERPDVDLIRAGAIGACYLGVMVWQAARRAVIEQGLPRPMAILLVNSDAYPFFDAPVMTCDEYLDDGALQVVTHQSAAVADDDFENEEPEAASLVGLASLGGQRTTAKKMALVLEGEDAYNPLGMGDDLVAQAAFDPTSVDISRFMPDASEFRNEPDEDEGEGAEWLEPDARDVHEELDANPYAGEIANPYAIDPPTPYGEDIAPDRAGDTANPYDERASQPCDEIEFPVDAPASTQSAPYETREQDAQWSAANADLATDERAPVHSEPESGSHGAGMPDAPMPWYGQESDLPYAPEPVSDQIAAPPASHSIRARIRVAPVDEPDRGDGPGFLAAIGRFLKRVQELLLRR